MTMRNWWWLLLLVGTLAGCGDDTSSNPDDGGEDDATSDGPGDVEDGPGGEGSAPECYLDLDCAFDSICVEGACVPVSPTGACPEPFDRGLRYRPIDAPGFTAFGGLADYPSLASCGPRCFLVCGTAGPFVLLHDYSVSPAESAIYTLPLPADAVVRCLAARKLSDGSIELAATDRHRALMLFNLAAGVATDVGSFTATEDAGYLADWFLLPDHVAIQEATAGELHAFAQDGTVWIHVWRSIPEPYQVAASYVWGGITESQARHSSSAIRPDGGLDVVIEYYWFDGTTMLDATPTGHILGSGLNPQTIVDRDARVIYSVWKPPISDPDPPSWPQPTVLFLSELLPGGVLGASWTADAPLAIGDPSAFGGYTHHLLWLQDRQTAVAYHLTNGGLGFPVYLVYSTPTDHRERELSALATAGLPTLTLLDVRTAFEPCSGFHGLVTATAANPEEPTNPTYRVGYFEW